MRCKCKDQMDETTAQNKAETQSEITDAAVEGKKEKQMLSNLCAK